MKRVAGGIMAKIRGWSKLYGGKGEHVWVNDEFDDIYVTVDYAGAPYNKWIVSLMRQVGLGGGEELSELAAFNNKQNAIKYAIGWMKARPRIKKFLSSAFGIHKKGVEV